MQYKHTPVMLKEVVEYLNPKPGQNYIDCTLGGGGYSMKIAKKIGNEGRILSIDLDKLAIKNAEQNIKKINIKNIILAYGNFKNLQKIVEEEIKEKKIEWSGVVFDLGLSSAQLEDKSRGFSFQLDAPLDMAFGDETRNEQGTDFVVNNYTEKDLIKILRDFGDEKHARRIAKGIIEHRKESQIKTTKQLVDIIEAVVPASYRRKKIHFATRTFQALRIETNKELESIKEALPQAVDLLKKGGRVVVISYHSLEDRIVKQYFKKESKGCLCPPDIPICQCDHKAKVKILTRKIVLPTDLEIEGNPRARSAKMRVIEKI